MSSADLVQTNRLGFLLHSGHTAGRWGQQHFATGLGGLVRFLMRPLRREQLVKHLRDRFTRPNEIVLLLGVRSHVRTKDLHTHATKGNYDRRFGERTHRVRSWPTLAAYLLKDTGDSGYVWRGQREATWGLVTSLERSFDSNKVHETEHGEREQRALSHFRANAASFLGWIPDENDVVSWSIAMQHYGCPTRFLDWTESPFVALYFAYSEIGDNQLTPGALWQFDARLALNALQKHDNDKGINFPPPRDIRPTANPSTESWPNVINRLVREHFQCESPIPLPVAPIRPDSRMIAQQTVLTVDATLQGGISYPLRTEAHLPLLLKIQLPAAWRREVLRNLSLMGVTAETLFPGTGGVAQHAARIIKDGFRHVRSELEGH
jgi:FRG domain